MTYRFELERSAGDTGEFLSVVLRPGPRPCPVKVKSTGTLEVTVFPPLSALIENCTR